MDTALADQMIALIFSQIRRRLEDAARIAAAAEACAVGGSVQQAVTVAMDIDQLLFDAGRLFDAALILRRTP